MWYLWLVVVSNWLFWCWSLMPILIIGYWYRCWSLMLKLLNDADAAHWLLMLISLASSSLGPASWWERVPSWLRPQLVIMLMFIIDSAADHWCWCWCWSSMLIIDADADADFLCRWWLLMLKLIIDADAHYFLMLIIYTRSYTRWIGPCCTVWIAGNDWQQTSPTRWLDDAFMMIQ